MALIRVTKTASVSPYIKCVSLRCLPRLCYLQSLFREVGRLTKYIPRRCSERAICVSVSSELSFIGQYGVITPNFKCGTF